ncbi:Putative uncharacterized protein FLJ37770 [Eumeta japonica]|uniref:Mos1 transposase HTH domain-containing protein n=1 Tax=Eumeta variegata TaxID=151549 RepID=A0A4C1UPS4_EUMVA|nr:Putative uncharacterized protein FLJ37770 [Eumeta japonica]
MDLNHENFRCMIFYYFKYNLAAQQSFARLRTAFGDEAPCRTTIYNWFAEFKRGRVDLSKGFCDGRPSIDVKNKNKDAVRCMIKTNRHVTYDKVQALLGIGISQRQSILHKHLAMKKLCPWWIPHNLTETQKTGRVTWYNALFIRFKEVALNWYKA